MILDPFFPYYGSCHSMARLYPRPRFGRLIEPFAGSACYSLHHSERDVVLIERDPVIAELWRWLIKVSPEDVLALPDLEPGQSTDDLEPGQSTDDLEVCPAARSLIGRWLNPATAGKPRKRATRFLGHPVNQCSLWGAPVRARVARQLPAIRHWTIVEGEAMGTTIHGEATWFVDPPFIGSRGEHYCYGSRLIDFAELGAWCRSLPGQVMVREQLGADWLPFERVGTVHGQRGKSTEVAWFSDERDRPSFRQPGLFAR